MEERKKNKTHSISNPTAYFQLPFQKYYIDIKSIKARPKLQRPISVARLLNFFHFSVCLAQASSEVRRSHISCGCKQTLDLAPVFIGIILARP